MAVSVPACRAAASGHARNARLAGILDPVDVGIRPYPVAHGGPCQTGVPVEIIIAVGQVDGAGSSDRAIDFLPNNGILLNSAASIGLSVR